VQFKFKTLNTQILNKLKVGNVCSAINFRQALCIFNEEELSSIYK